MAIGERFRSGGTHGVARFLADHQRCDAGFDVRREDQPGSGKLKITCEGCGRSVAYRAAEAMDLAPGTLGGSANGDASTVEPATGDYKGPPPTSAGPAAPSRRPVPPPTRSRPGLPAWIPLALIAALILGGAGMIAAGLLSSDDSPEAVPDQQPTSGADAEPQGREPKPTEPQSPQQQQGSAQEPDQGNELPLERPLERARVAGIFAIGVPAGWERGEAGDGAISFEVSDGTAEVRVYHEPGERQTQQLASAAAGFLADEHRGAEVSEPEVVRVDGTRGAEVIAVYRGGEERAVVLSKGGYAFLLLCRVDRGAGAQRDAEAEAIVASFKPA